MGRIRLSATHLPAAAGLYDPRFEHDACGVSFVARISGQPSHDVVDKAVEAVANLSHPGAVAADGKSGDGSGVLTQIPRKLLARDAERQGWHVAEHDLLGVGMLFFPPRDTASQEGWDRTQQIVEDGLLHAGARVLGWRDVPLNPDELGAAALQTLPLVRQVLVAPAWATSEDAFETCLYHARKEIERAADEAGLVQIGFYLPSLSCRTVVYKGLFAAHQLPAFYTDLRDPDYESALAILHQRYSTNTFPTWQLAQPLRLLAHNGEINTLRGNRAWMRAREASLPAAVRPVLWEDGSDSTSLDEALQLVERSGRSLSHAVSMLMPAAWEGDPELPAGTQAFYRYHAPIMEPWDGPAALAFSDGHLVGAALDRNGLRPCRYEITQEGLIVVGSEVGAIELDDYRVVEKGRLGPGQILIVDLKRHVILHDAEVKKALASGEPWAAWLAESPRLHLGAAAVAEHYAAEPTGLPLPVVQRAMGYSNEDLRIALRPMGAEAQDAVWSMGDDTPLGPLATTPRSVYDFFRQRFAQVTNPPIDPIRESLVMSLRTWLGARPSLMQTSGAHSPLLELDAPVIAEATLRTIRTQKLLKVAEVSATFAASDQPPALEARLRHICDAAEEEARNGAQIILLSDRETSASQAPVPMLLAVGAVHQRLLQVGLRTAVDLVVEAGDAWDLHQLAALIGFGAGAVCPWLALRTVANLGDDERSSRITAAQAIANESSEGSVDGAARAARPNGPRTSVHVGTQSTSYPDPEIAEHNYLKAANKGLLKIMSKMGISIVSSYRGGQIFECLGLSDEVVDTCFTGTTSPIGGLRFEDLARHVLDRHAAAFRTDATPRLPDYGQVRFRRDGEKHAWEPPVVRALHKAMDAAEPDQTRTTWDDSVRLLQADEQPKHLRDLLEIHPDGEPVPLDEVEPAQEIVKRFVCTAMSLGALSPEAHETLAVGMNRLGARSNSGEGGEDPASYAPTARGDRRDNKIKQVSSGRFGVTATYLAHADELEIKMAQGSKPGEGGQLPAHKVTDLIARLRYAVPGFSLISPPPHHDVYSIEDLAQLIFDLKRVNPAARIGVNLVSESGVGTVAAGVAKAYADYVLISGYDGGTGASPLSSIKHAGSPWELGVAEAQQVLVQNDLRGRLRVRTDGGLREARDVVVAALLGAEEFGFGTASLVAIGCDMARQCHLNTCPTGIATQRPELRAKFTGSPEQVMAFFTYLAEDVRVLLARLGFRRLEDAVGRVDLLDQARALNGLDLRALLRDPDPSGRRARHCERARNDRPDTDEFLDEKILRDAQRTLAKHPFFPCESRIRNRDRTIGARLAGEIGAGRLSHYVVEQSAVRPAVKV